MTAAEKKKKDALTEQRVNNAARAAAAFAAGGVTKGLSNVLSSRSDWVAERPWFMPVMSTLLGTGLAAFGTNETVRAVGYGINGSAGSDIVDEYADDLLNGAAKAAAKSVIKNKLANLPKKAAAAIESAVTSVVSNVSNTTSLPAGNAMRTMAMSDALYGDK